MDVSKVYMARSAKGQEALCVDDYLYIYDGRKQAEIFRWICSRNQSKIPCESRVTTILVENEDGSTTHQVETISGEHFHDRFTPSEVARFVERKRLADLVAQSHGTESNFGKRKNDGAPKRIKRIKKSDSVGGISNIILDFDDKELVYILHRRDGRKMACVDGKLYYLIGKSVKHEIYRWHCVHKRDGACNVQIYTEPTINGSHRLYQMRGVPEQKHIHGSYMAENLANIFVKHNISIVDDEDIAETLAEDNIKYFDTKDGETVDNIDDGYIWSNCIDTQPPAAVGKQVAFEQLERYRTHSFDPLVENDPTKFTFLPSAKGRKLLCMNRYLYHLDSHDKCNGHLFWSCTKKRVEGIKCNARVSMSFKNDEPYINKGPSPHCHEQSIEDITMCMQRGQHVEPCEFVQIDSTIKKTLSNMKAESSDSEESCDGLANFEDHLQINDLPTICKMRTKAPSNSEYVDVVVVDGADDDQDDMALLKELDMVEEYLEEVDENYLLELDASKKKRKKSTEKNVRRINKVSEKNSTTQAEEESDMDLTKISKLRSAKGSELLCIDGYIFHAKHKNLLYRNYWVCIKCRDPKYFCNSRVSTVPTENGGIRVLKVHSRHTHPVFEDDIKRRLYNEIKVKNNNKCKFKPHYFLNKTIEEINNEYGDLAVKHLVAEFEDNETNQEELIESQELETEADDGVIDFTNIEAVYTMKLYSVSDGPPSIAVRMTLKALNLNYEIINVDYIASEHLTDQYAKMNPQKEIPVLDDDGFFLPESIAIQQYLCDKYAPDSTIYPKEAQARALVNHRLCFNKGFYFASIAAHGTAPVFFNYQRTDMSLKKVKNALNVFETYLQRGGTKYAASDNITIADYALVASTLCLEAIDFDFTPYPLVDKWYKTFKKEQPELWAIGNEGMQEIKAFEKNPPDLSHMDNSLSTTNKA